MARYEHITRFIPALEGIASEEEGRRLEREFVEAFYESVLDREYLDTLERHGLLGARSDRANIESMELEAAIALLTLIQRSERAMYDPSDKTPLLRSFEDGYGLRVLRRIAELDGTWARPNVVTFYHEYEKDGYLSNWYESGFSFYGDVFPTAEHWMMWQKAQAFRDWDTAAKVLEATSPDAAKKLGKQVKPYSDATWSEARVPLMKVGLRQKFAQNERLMNDLLSTGSAALAEASPKDTVWGIGVGKDDPGSADLGKWHGRNLLGITLMEVRSELRSLSSIDGVLEWPIERLADSHVWRMRLLELARVPSTRPAALMYAAIVAQNVPHWHGTRDALRKVDAPIGEIDESMHLNMGGGLPIAGWHELLDELALQVRLGRV